MTPVVLEVVLRLTSTNEVNAARLKNSASLCSYSSCSSCPNVGCFFLTDTVRLLLLSVCNNGTQSDHEHPIPHFLTCTKFGESESQRKSAQEFAFRFVLYLGVGEAAAVILIVWFQILVHGVMLLNWILARTNLQVCQPILVCWPILKSLYWVTMNCRQVSVLSGCEQNINYKFILYSIFREASVSCGNYGFWIWRKTSSEVCRMKSVSTFLMP